jgi:hypothetical protein
MPTESYNISPRLFLITLFLTTGPEWVNTLAAIWAAGG